MTSAVPYAVGSAVSAIITAVALLYNTRWQNGREPAREIREQQREVYVRYLAAVEIFLHDWPASVRAENEAHEKGEPFDAEEYLDLGSSLSQIRDAERLMVLLASPLTQKHAATLTSDFIAFIRGLDPEKPIYMNEAIDKGWEQYDRLVSSMRRDLSVRGGVETAMRMLR